MNLLRVPGCACFTLELGAKIIGCLELVAYGVFVILSMTMLILLGQHHRYPTNQLYGLFITTLILGCVALAITSIFLYGVHKRRYLLLRPWMVCAVIDMSITFVMLILISYFVDDAARSLKGLMIFIIVIDCFWLVFKLYFFLVVYKYHKSLVDMEIERIRQQTNTPQTNQIPYQQTQRIPHQLDVQTTHSQTVYQESYENPKNFKGNPHEKNPPPPYHQNMYPEKK